MLVHIEEQRRKEFEESKGEIIFVEKINGPNTTDNIEFEILHNSQHPDDEKEKQLNPQHNYIAAATMNSRDRDRDGNYIGKNNGRTSAAPTRHARDRDSDGDSDESVTNKSTEVEEKSKVDVMATTADKVDIPRKSSLAGQLPQPIESQILKVSKMLEGSPDSDADSSDDSSASDEKTNTTHTNNGSQTLQSTTRNASTTSDEFDKKLKVHIFPQSNNVTYC